VPNKRVLDKGLKALAGLVAAALKIAVAHKQVADGLALKVRLSSLPFSGAIGFEAAEDRAGLRARTETSAAAPARCWSG